MSPLGPVVPVTGDPAAVDELARGLRDLAARIGSIEERLADLRGAAGWESPSGARFDEGLAALPPVLGLLRDRYAAAGDALLRWVVQLRLAIDVTERAAERHLQARIELDGIERDLQSAAADPRGGWYAALQTRHALALARAQEAQDAAGRAWRRLHDDADECAARLRAAAADSMVDSTAYSLVRGTRSVISGLTGVLGLAALVPAPTQPFAAAGAGVGTAAGVGADLLLLVGFGDGTLWDVAKSAGWAAAGKGASGLTRAAGAGALRNAEGAWVGRPMPTPARLQAGRDQIRRELAEQRAALRTPIADRSAYAPRLGGTRPPMIGPQQQLHVRTLRTIEDRIETKVLGINDRWQMARANGRNAVVLQGGSEAIRIARRAHDVHRTTETWTEVGSRESERYGGPPRS